MKAKWLRGIIYLFILALPIINWPTLGGSFSEESRRTHVRLQDLRKTAGSEDVLMTISLQDPLVQLIDQNLFDPANRPAPFRNHWLINIASEHVSLWRQQFAAFVLEQWGRNREVWVTKGALRDRPDQDSMWVEGDNPGVYWRDIPSFFKTLEVDRQTDGADGFVRIHRSPEMQDRLAKLSAVASGQLGK